MRGAVAKAAKAAKAPALRAISLNDCVGFRIQPKARRAAYLRHLRSTLKFLEEHEDTSCWPQSFEEFLAPDANGIHWAQMWDLLQAIPIEPFGPLPFEIVIRDEKAKP